MKSPIITRFVATAILTSQSFMGTIALQELALRHHVSQSNYAAQAQEGDRDAAYVYAKAKPAIVYIETKTDRGGATGSGVIIESSGIVITNAHVIEGAQEITVELSNGQRIKPKVLSVGKSGCLDLAILQLPNQQNLPTIALENPQSVSPGQTVFAMGFPQGIKPASITQGIVSNLHQELGFIQLDAAIGPGNSGGALLNAQGHLVGINTLKLKDQQGMNFAIDLTRIQAFLQTTQQGLSPTLGRYVKMTSGQSSELVIDRPAITGRLQTGDHQVCNDNSPANLYTFKGTANQSIVLTMQGQSIKPFMILLGPDGKKIGNTSADNGQSMARFYTRLPLNGTYTLIANTQEANQFGTYQLQAVTPMLFRKGELGSGDRVLSDGSPYQRYDFSGKAGQRVTLSINSTQFEPFIAIVDNKDKLVWKGHLESGKGLNVSLPNDGQYKVLVSTMKPNEGGPYSIAIEPAMPQVTAALP